MQTRSGRAFLVSTFSGLTSAFVSVPTSDIFWKLFSDIFWKSVSFVSLLLISGCFSFRSFSSSNFPIPPLLTTWRRTLFCVTSSLTLASGDLEPGLSFKSASHLVARSIGFTHSCLVSVSHFGLGSVFKDISHFLSVSIFIAG